MTSIFDARGLIAFTGDNDTDTVIANIHFNLTTLRHWNYTLYDNGTLSNGSKCILTFAPYTPTLLYPNGTFINSTSCYSPINDIGCRATIGVALASVFGLLLVLCLMSLRKHGRRYLPAEKRFRPVGRRWQWYWGVLACAMALISLFTSVDVDRYYIAELPIVLTSFFWYLMQLCTIALCWEAVRHWGSWRERQLVDPNPFALPLDDRRARLEFFIPLVFYLLWWLNFFLLIPRNWGLIEQQRSPEQTALRAKPGATGVRFKIAAFFLLAAWCVIAFSLQHSARHYLPPRNRGFIGRATRLFVRGDSGGGIPLRFVLLLPLSFAMVAYQALGAWQFEWSVLDVKGNKLAIFLGGYAPTLLIVLIQVIYGWRSSNEDRELIRQRRLRGAETDRELGIVRKPAWWRRINGSGGSGDLNESMRDRIARNVREIGGGRATARNIDRTLASRAREAEIVEMNEMQTASASTAATGKSNNSNVYSGKSDHLRTERTVQAAASMLFPSSAVTAATATSAIPVNHAAELTMDGPPPSYRDAEVERLNERGRSRQMSINAQQRHPVTAERSNSTDTTASLSGPPQQVRSMLDV